MSAAQDWNGAIAALDRAIQSHPADADLYKRRAATLEYLGRNDEAERDFERATRLQPDDADAWESLVELRDWTKKGDRRALASDYAEHVVHAEPNDALHHRNLARLLDGSGNPDGAKREFRAAIALAPDEATYYLEFASYLQEHAASAEAIALLQDGARRDTPERLTILKELGTIAFTTQEYQIAAAAFAQAAVVAPGNQQFADLLTESRRRAAAR